MACFHLAPKDLITLVSNSCPGQCGTQRKVAQVTSSIPAQMAESISPITGLSVARPGDTKEYLWAEDSLLCHDLASCYLAAHLGLYTGLGMHVIGLVNPATDH